MRRISNLLIATLVVLFGCGSKSLPERELLEFVVDPANELKRSVENGPIKIEVLYKPSDLVMARDLKEIADPMTREATLSSLDTLTYFVISLSSNGHEIENAYANDPRRFGAAVNYLSYGVLENLQIINEGDTIAPLDVVYSRAFGSAGSSQLLAVFNANLKERSGLVDLQLNDKVFGTGLSRFKFDCDKLKEIPRLRIP